MPHLETAVQAVIESPESHPFARAALLGASHLFRSGVALRKSLYGCGIFSPKKAPLPIVSIGNIAAGGTGKTPFVEKLARDIRAQREVAILTRGYRGGDEAELLRRHLKLPVYVGKDRHAGAQKAFEEGADIALLDDGMQHLALHRDLEIVVVHGDDPFGKGHFLPRGYLREGPTALERADFVVVSHARDQEQIEAVRPYTAAPLIGVRFVPHPCGISGKKVALFCGIGRPEGFVQTVEELGACVVHSLFLPDHKAPSDREMAAFFKKSIAHGAEHVVCTEKDWVKIKKPLESPIPVSYVGASLSVSFGKREYEALIEKVVTL